MQPGNCWQGATRFPYWHCRHHQPPGFFYQKWKYTWKTLIYIRSRVEQTGAAIAAGGDEMNISVVERPYIFGSLPGKTPLWKPLISYILSGLPLFYPAGGTTCVTVHQVGQANSRGGCEGGNWQMLPIGGKNLTWVQLLEMSSQLVGKPKKVITLPTGLVKVAAGIVRLFLSIQGKESGLEPVSFSNLQTRNTFIDSEAP